MNEKDALNLLKDYPEIINLTVEMPKANQPISIYNGNFILKNERIEIEPKGKIYFNWFPDLGSNFECEIYLEHKSISLLGRTNPLSLLIKDKKLGDVFITSTKFGSADIPVQLKGFLNNFTLLGDKTIPVDTIKFSVPNLREFRGTAVKHISESKIRSYANRVRFEDEKYQFILDKSFDYSERNNSLIDNGGYIINYAGQLKLKNNNPITFSETKEIFECFHYFISFLNGRRTSALFKKGSVKDEDFWIDYTNYYTDPFKIVNSWTSKSDIYDFDKIWKSFRKLWKDPESKNFLTSVIHWYVEANGNSGLIEGSIILSQTALELIYNWWVIEKKGMLSGKDKDNISASNKIRLLLSQINQDFNVPSFFSNLQKIVNKSNEISDAPDAIVFIRNAIVHSQADKRKKLSEIPATAKFEALQVSIWYIELLLLKILGFEGKYHNRCAEPYARGVTLPWVDNI